MDNRRLKFLRDWHDRRPDKVVFIRVRTCMKYNKLMEYKELLGRYDDHKEAHGTSEDGGYIHVRRRRR